VTETIAWPSPPNTTDNVDTPENYNMGMRFSLVAGANCVGVQWRVPDAVETPSGGTHVVSLWSVVGEVRLAAADFTPVPGGYQQVMFASPVALSASTSYVVAVYTRHYVHRAGAFPVTSPSGNIIGDEGKLINNNSGGNPGFYPANLSNAFYYVSPIMETAESTTPVTSTLTAKWRVYGKASTTLTARWRVWSRVESTLRAKWHVFAAPTPTPEVSGAYLTVQRMMTLAYIRDDPTTLELVPVSRVTTPSGGFAEVDGVPRAAQTVKMILLAYDQRPTLTVAGVERIIDYHMFGRWDMAAEVGDYWIDEEGTRWDIVGFSEGWDYMTKAFASRHVPRPARP